MDASKSKSKGVFISYTHLDQDFVNKFCKLLVDFDVPFWRDSKNIGMGGEILDTVYQGIKNFPTFCCIISSTSVNSAWVKEELKFAKHCQLEGTSLKIVPLLIDAVEIPDYVKVYRCAHLEDRSLSIKNPELRMTLEAFGVDFHETPPIIVDQQRQWLLGSCLQFREAIVLLRATLATFEKRYDTYSSAKLANKHIMVRTERVTRRGLGLGTRRSSGYKLAPNPAYYKIKHERDNAMTAIIDLREKASWMLDPIKKVKLALKVAGLETPPNSNKIEDANDLTMWNSLRDALGQAGTMSKTILKIPREKGEVWRRGDGWDQLTGITWVREVPRWMKSISSILSIIDGTISTLDYWSRFDSESSSESN